MGKRSSSGSSGRPMSETEFRVYDCLARERDFLSSMEIVDKTDIRLGSFFPAIDRLYASRLVMTRFVVQNQAIIVTCDEVGIPEIGFSRQLDTLLVGIGMDKENWASASKQYAALEHDGGFPDFIPEGVAPFEVFSL